MQFYRSFYGLMVCFEWFFCTNRKRNKNVDRMNKVKCVVLFAVFDGKHFAMINDCHCVHLFEIVINIANIHYATYDLCNILIIYTITAASSMYGFLLLILFLLFKFVFCDDMTII